MDSQFIPFMTAAYEGDLARFQDLVIQHPEVVSQESSISHPSLLQFVAVEGGLGKIARPEEFAKILIEAGWPLNESLVAAASVNAREVLDVILQSGAPIEACHPWTALEEALYWGRTELAHYLRELGARVLSLRAAAGLGDLALLETFFDGDGVLLAEAGPVRFPFGEESSERADVINQALLVALRNRQYPAASKLVELGADVNALAPGNHERCSPLHLAAHRNDLQMVEWLLERGADPSITDPRFGDTAAGWARHFGHESLAAYLESQGE